MFVSFVVLDFVCGPRVVCCGCVLYMCLCGCVLWLLCVVVVFKAVCLCL